MTISVNTAWNVQSDGAATNGGGFVVGASGTNYSLQAAAQIAVTDAVANGSTTITSATAAFAAAHVGNIIYMAGGSGSLTAGWYQVVTRSNATTITVDRSVAAGTGITLNLGGALTFGAIASIPLARSHAIFLKYSASTYDITATTTLSVGGAPQDGFPANRFVGYNTTPGDIVPGGLTRPTIKLLTNSGLTALNVTAANGGWFIENIIVDCNSLTTSTGIGVGGSAAWVRIFNCKISNFTTAGITVASAVGTAYNSIQQCEITAGTSAATAALNVTLGGTNEISFNKIHTNACPGIVCGGAGGTFAFNLITGNTGASSDGIRCSYGAVILNNTIHGNGRDGIRFSNTLYPSQVVKNNIITSNGGYGLTGSSAAAVPAWAALDGNAYRANTSGARNLADGTPGTFAMGSYTNTQDVTLTADPYTSAAGGDFSLNSTAGGGAAAKGTAQPGAIVAHTATGSMDFGAFQASAAASESFAFKIKTVGPNGSLPGGGNPDYTTLQSWWNAVKTSSSAGQWAECYGGGDLGQLDLAGGTFTPSATSFVRIYAARSDRHAGVYSAAKARISVTGAGEIGIDCASGNAALRYCRIEGLQIVATSATAARALRFQGVSDCIIDGLLVTPSASGNKFTGRGIVVGTSNVGSIANCEIKNCILANPDSTANTAIQLNAEGGTFTATGMLINNCSTYGWQYGIGLETTSTSTGDVTVKNCACMGSSAADFGLEAGTGWTKTGSYNLSGDATADDWGSTGALISQTSAVVFKDTANSDLRLKTGSPAINRGTSVASVTADALGVLRSTKTNYDIGAQVFILDSWMLSESGINQ